MSVLIFSTNFVPNISHSTNNWARCDQNVYWPSCKVLVPVVRFYWKLNFLEGRRGRRRKKLLDDLNPLTPNDLCISRTAPLTSKRCILYIYSTNVGTEHFKHALCSPSFSLQNAVCFIMLTSLVPVLFTFYILGVLKLKKIISAPKG